MEWLKLEASNLVYMLIIASPYGWQIVPESGVVIVTWPLWFLEHNIWKMVTTRSATEVFWHSGALQIGLLLLLLLRDSLIVSIKFEQEVVRALSNGYVADDLG